MPHGRHPTGALIPREHGHDPILRGYKSDTLPLIKHELGRRLMARPPKFRQRDLLRHTPCCWLGDDEPLRALPGMQRLDFGAKGQHLHLIIDNDGPIDRRELANKRQGADQPIVKIVSLPGEKMVVDRVQLLLTRRIAQRQGPSSSEKLLILSWLRVFKSANTAHLGHCGGQEREPRVVPSEKYAARRGSVSAGMRMIPACFARALQRCSSRIGMHFLLTFQGVMPIGKTRNRLIFKY